MTKKVVIAGAGPAGLTAALELLRQSDCQPILFELDTQVGGISKTVNHNGNRMDIGGHRFFSKSQWVMDWWREILPIYTEKTGSETIQYQNRQTELPVDATADSESRDVMLLRPRLSRIYFLRKFFDYPLKLNGRTFSNLGIVRLVRAGLSYLKARLMPIRPEKNLRDFIVNRFGHELYATFFRDYTEKVWGVSCEEISSEWGAQRIKGVSVTAVLMHAVTQPFKKLFGVKGKVKTSLIEQFLYPRLGPGHLWEVVADKIESRGGVIKFRHVVESIVVENGRVAAANVRDLETGATERVACDEFISTMPVRELVGQIEGELPPGDVSEVAKGLIYRDFITVGLLLKKFKASKYTDESAQNMLPDNWIYIQEPDVKVGRLQIFNNWCPDLVADRENTVWVGMEYFCSEGDDLWSLSEEQLKKLAAEEMAEIGLVESEDVLDAHVIKVPKAYPAYFGSYDQFELIKDYVDTIPNLYLVGRNGMHRYNNQDHSMLTAKLAVECILDETQNKSEIWSINIDDEYHEEEAEAS